MPGLVGSNGRNEDDGGKDEEVAAAFISSISSMNDNDHEIASKSKEPGLKL